MAKIKKTKVDGALVYPATIFPAVKDPNTGQTLTDKLAELGSEVSELDCSINKVITREFRLISGNVVNETITLAFEKGVSCDITLTSSIEGQFYVIFYSKDLEEHTKKYMNSGEKVTIYNYPWDLYAIRIYKSSSEIVNDGVLDIAISNISTSIETIQDANKRFFPKGELSFTNIVLDGSNLENGKDLTTIGAIVDNDERSIYNESIPINSDGVRIVSDVPYIVYLYRADNLIKYLPDWITGTYDFYKTDGDIDCFKLKFKSGTATWEDINLSVKQITVNSYKEVESFFKEDIIPYCDKHYKPCVDISKLFPKGGLNGGNKYKFIDALNLVPNECRTQGIHVSYIDATANKYVEWELTGPSWTFTRSYWKCISDELALSYKDMDITTGTNKIDISKLLPNRIYKVVISNSWAVTTLSEGTSYFSIDKLYNNSYVESDIIVRAPNSIENLEFYFERQENYSYRITYRGDNGQTVSFDFIDVTPAKLNQKVQTLLPISSYKSFAKGLDSSYLLTGYSISSSGYVISAPNRAIYNDYVPINNNGIKITVTKLNVSFNIALYKEDKSYIGNVFNLSWCEESTFLWTNDRNAKYIKLVFDSDDITLDSLGLSIEDILVTESKNIPEYVEGRLDNALANAFFKGKEINLDGLGWVLNEAYTQTAFSGAHLNIEPTKGIGYVTGMVSTTKYGEAGGHIMIVAFPCLQPYRLEYYTVAQTGDLDVDGNPLVGEPYDCMSMSFYDSDNVFIIRTFFQEWHGLGLYYRDFNTSTKQFKSACVKVKYYNSENQLVDVTGEGIRAWVESQGGSWESSQKCLFSNHIINDKTLWDDGDYIYSVLTAGAGQSPTSNPVVVKSDDNFATLHLVTILPVAAIYEACIAKLNGVIYILYRIDNRGGIFFQTCDSNFDNYTELQHIPKSASQRPEILIHNNNVYLFVGTNDNKDNINGPRSAYHLYRGTSSSFEDYADVLTLKNKFGLVYASAVFFNNRLLLAYSTNELMLNDDVGGKSTMKFYIVKDFYDGV